MEKQAHRDLNIPLQIKIMNCQNQLILKTSKCISSIISVILKIQFTKKSLNNKSLFFTLRNYH